MKKAKNDTVGNIDKTNMPDNTNNNISAIEMPVANDNVFSEENLKSLKDKKEQKTGEKRTYRKRKTQELSEAEIQQLMLPLFLLTNKILEKRKIEPLDHDEISGGIKAWYPLIDHYMPYLDKYALFIPPAMWTTSIIIMRMDVPDKEIKEKTGEVKQVNAANANA